jgi:hypothetical protein
MFYRRNIISFVFIFYPIEKNLAVSANGQETMAPTRTYLLTVICDARDGSGMRVPGKQRSFRISEFKNEKQILRDIKLLDIADDKIINRDSSKPFSTDEFLDMFSRKNRY